MSGSHLLRTAKKVAKKVFGPPMDPDQVHPIDPDALSLVLPLIDLLERYFRAEVRGVEHIPVGKALIVGNHNAGMTFLEPFLFGAAWYRQRGELDAHGLGHDAIVGMPVVGNLLMMLGAVRASHANADTVFAMGRKVVVFPGGNYESFRPWTQRHRVDFGGHKGFVRLALRHGVPIVPLLSLGGHSTLFIVFRGERLARWTGLKRFFRSDALPLIIALPYGVFLGPNFHLPLPVKCTVVAGEPISLAGTRPEDAKDPQVVDRVYQQVVGQLQEMMDAELRARQSERQVDSAQSSASSSA